MLNFAKLLFFAMYGYGHSVHLRLRHLENIRMLSGSEACPPEKFFLKYITTTTYR